MGEQTLNVCLGSAIHPVADALNGQHIVHHGTQIGVIRHQVLLGQVVQVV